MTELQTIEPLPSDSSALVVSVAEAGRLLGISRDLTYDLVARHELPSIKLGRRIVIPRRALEEFLAARVRSSVSLRLT